MSTVVTAVQSGDYLYPSIIVEGKGILKETIIQSHTIYKRVESEVELRSVWTQNYFTGFSCRLTSAIRGFLKHLGEGL